MVADSISPAPAAQEGALAYSYYIYDAACSDVCTAAAVHVRRGRPLSLSAFSKHAVPSEVTVVFDGDDIAQLDRDIRSAASPMHMVEVCASMWHGSD